MPVGVPKIPFRVPGEEEATWIDVYNRLYWERLLFLGDEVDEFISNLLASLMILLGILDPTRDIFLFINSPGGFMIPGMLLFDTMQWVRPVVHTTGMGIVASMAAFILAGGQITQRVALPYARVMMHQPTGTFFEEEEYNKKIADEVFLEMLELMELYKDVINIFAERTGVPIWTLIVDIERDVFMSAEEAQAHGIVDLVGLDMELISPRQPSVKIFL